MSDTKGFSCWSAKSRNRLVSCIGSDGELDQTHRGDRLDKYEKSLKIWLSTQAQLVKSECPPTRIKVAFSMQSQLQQRQMSSPLDVHFGIAEVLVSF
ncbi:hypothetical protein OAE26_00915 [Synechococcus sp. AH-551-E05]|jgi:hypothetical protein|nr:hypothetical protein [Synechococcus sp. AH-551-E05]